MTHSFTDGEPTAPPPEDDAPMMMGNPVLSRRTPVHRKGSNSLGWYVGVPVAVVAVGALAFVVASNVHQRSSLTTTATDTSTTTRVAPVAPAGVAPTPAPAATAPVQIASASPTETPVAPPAAITPRPQRLASVDRHGMRAVHRSVTRRAAAASENAADTSASATAAVAPTTTPPPAAPSAPIVISPPPP